MDVIACGILTFLECHYLPQFRGRDLGNVRIAVIFLIQYFVLKFYSFYLYPKLLSPLRNLPGPKDGLPLIGQAYNFFNSPPAELYISWMKQWPSAPMIRFLDFGNREVVVLNNVRSTKEVLQSNCYTFVKPAFLRRVLGEITGTGLLFAEGESHKHQRKMLAGPFSHSTIKAMLPFFKSKAEELCVAMGELADRHLHEPVELSSVLAKTTLDAIGLSVLGVEFNNLHSPSQFSLAFEGVFGQERSTLSVIMALLNAHMPIRKLLPIKVNRDYLGANAKIRRLLVQRVRERKREMGSADKSDEPANDLLSVLLRERVGGKPAFTEDDIVNHLLNFMAAGHETTAGLLTLTLLTLTTHPDVQSRLRKEIFDAIPTDDSLSYSSVESLSLLSNMAKEVLRLYPPALASHREASKKVVIDGITLPKGTIVHIVPAAIHYNPLIWGADAEKFDPGRWDRLPKSASDPYAAGSFLNGPRICIGKSFGLLEYKTYMIQLLKNFEFSGSGGPIQFQRGGPSLRLQGGLVVGEALAELIRGFGKVMPPRVTEVQVFITYLGL